MKFLLRESIENTKYKILMINDRKKDGQCDFRNFKILNAAIFDQFFFYGGFFFYLLENIFLKMGRK